MNDDDGWEGNDEVSWCIPISSNPKCESNKNGVTSTDKLMSLLVRVSQDLVECKVYICDKTEQTFVDECWWPSETKSMTNKIHQIDFGFDKRFWDSDLVICWWTQQEQCKTSVDLLVIHSRRGIASTFFFKDFVFVVLCFASFLHHESWLVAPSKTSIKSMKKIQWLFWLFWIPLTSGQWSWGKKSEKFFPISHWRFGLWNVDWTLWRSDLHPRLQRNPLDNWVSFDQWGGSGGNGEIFFEC